MWWVAPQLELDPDEADAKYKEIQEAYEILTTPERKMLFDSKPANLVSAQFQPHHLPSS